MANQLYSEQHDRETESTPDAESPDIGQRQSDQQAIGTDEDDTSRGHGKSGEMAATIHHVILPASAVLVKGAGNRTVASPTLTIF